ncbi:kinase non-catalytic C-lobe domain-containing protein 1 isoform X4 [Oncorhynchus tshawytscha]|uniref:kinase non-catalytic C-lobe domain-containing protein 1 isoform X4 n=1 Tax=Oncorhynchus tshawytscha TaxID=74940 RepID=UPI000D0A014A|nr:kinase non-catalytic C-lobe domain-containing protein 1 isoform X4 [Oncorhynchus tshawytscha]
MQLGFFITPISAHLAFHCLQHDIQGCRCKCVYCCRTLTVLLLCVHVCYSCVCMSACEHMHACVDACLCVSPQENVSLADILSLRDICLTEQEVWAVCVECVLALQSIASSPLFHTLCITPDTLAFNAHGNVCFMEQLSDDPEGSFIPPEFDKTGSTFEGHVYSLGSTLSAALDFVIEPELEAELGEEIQRLLEQMQEERPEDRPLPQDLLSLAEEKLVDTSSTALCRKLSSIGRRVLSIESVATFQDGWRGSWEARWQQPKPNWQLHKSIDSEDSSSKNQGIVSHTTAENPDLNDSNGLHRHHVCGAWDSTLWADGMGDVEENGCVRGEDMFGSQLDSRSQNSSPVHRRAQERAGRVRGVLNRSCSVPDSNNPPAFPPTPHGDISVNVSDLTEIGAEECMGHGSVWSTRGDREKATYECNDSEQWDSARDSETLEGERDSTLPICGAETDSDSQSGTRDETSSSRPAQDPDMLVDSACNMTSTSNLYTPNNHMTKSMLCLNEQSQDEWISLRDLLTRSGQRLSVNELWALCHTCLSTLQTYLDYPAYLCLDTMYVGCEGEVLFLKPKNTGSCDAFYLAPEFQEHGIVTEKACVYGVAAILWATAKFNLSANQKLAMPRKLKMLLLEMAKRTPIERPSIVVAKKSCRDYLSRLGTNAETVWTNLINRVHPPLTKDIDAEDQNGLDSRVNSSQESTRIKSGFVPMATESRLAPVPGPVPHSYPINGAPQLPEAFTSLATHFNPIILTREGDTEETPLPASDIEEAISEVTRGNDIEPVQEAKDRETPSHLEDLPLPQSDRDLHDNGRDSPANQRSVVTRNLSSTALSGRTLVNSPPPTSPKLSNQRTPVSDHPLPPPTTQLTSSSSCQSSSCSHLTGGGVFNNFLLRQDPLTGHLTLVPVQITVPESLHGLELNLPLTSSSSYLQGQPTHPRGPRDHLTPGQGAEPLLECLNGRPSNPKASMPHPHNGEGGPRTGEGEGEHLSESHGPPQGDSLPPPSPLMNPSLQEVIGLLRAEFAFDGYLESGVEDLAMGECFLSLKDLQYQTFCNVVKENFCNLYWDEDLLGVLHCVVNYSQLSLGSNEQSPSKPWQRAATSPLSASSCIAEEREALRRGHVDLNGNLHHSGPVASASWERFERHQRALSAFRETETRPEHKDTESEEGQHHVCPGRKGLRAAECLVKGAMESAEHPVGGGDESPSEADSLWGTDEPLRVGHRGQMSPDCCEDMEDTESLVSHCLLSPSSGAEESSHSHSPAWALAFYGGDCFSQDVVEYARNLGQHSESPCLELKTQVLSVDQWGVDVSLLPSLAASDPGSPLDLQPSEEPAVLGLVSLSGAGTGKSSLQAATPLDFMSYLYARNAPLEGYIQQFLYTYRYFCTPQELLQFLMGKFTSAVAGGDPDVSGDSAKVYHRSLDVLQTWLTDYIMVDFSPKSSLLMTLENFLTTEVSPLDRRGERLLTTLQRSPRKRWSQGCGSPISMQEDDDDALSVHTSCRKSAIEYSGRKSFQWRISRVVEPQSTQPKDKAYSIAAALPRPYYTSLMDNISSACLRSEERHPFSQSEHSTQHTAQQLTLLQQEMFQGCHPIHFLNSKSQGVRDKAVFVTKHAAHSVPPVEGSSLFVHEGTPQDSHLQQLLRYADSVSNWVSAEIVICDSIKIQAALLTKFLLIAKHCYESRDFATAMQVLGGLENVIVRQLPAWKHLSTKVCEVLEDLRAVQVFLKSDNLCLMGGEHVRRRPTLPAVHILTMHIQQLEIGAFTLTSGAYKWPKLRTIAKVVSQVHAFQETVYSFTPDPGLQAYIRLRIAHLSGCDIPLLAADNEANFHHNPTDRHTRRIQDTLKRVKATFQ